VRERGHRRNAHERVARREQNRRVGSTARKNSSQPIVVHARPKLTTGPSPNTSSTRSPFGKTTMNVGPPIQIFSPVSACQRGW
jgi:hypothetical protein